MKRILLDVPNRRRAWRVQDQALPIKFVELNRGPNLLWGLNRRHSFRRRDFFDQSGESWAGTGNIRRKKRDIVPGRLVEIDAHYGP